VTDLVVRALRLPPTPHEAEKLFVERGEPVPAPKRREGLTAD
jgi:hypothetical protein